MTTGLSALVRDRFGPILITYIAWIHGVAARGLCEDVLHTPLEPSLKGICLGVNINFFLRNTSHLAFREKFFAVNFIVRYSSRDRRRPPMADRFRTRGHAQGAQAGAGHELLGSGRRAHRARHCALRQTGSGHADTREARKRVRAICGTRAPRPANGGRRAHHARPGARLAHG